MNGFFKKYGWLYLPGLLFLSLSAYLQTLLPLLLGKVIDILNAPDMADRTKSVLLQLLYMLLAAAAAFASRYLWRYFIMGNSRYMEIWLRRRLFDQLLILPAAFYQRQKTGNLMAYAINDIGAIRQTFGPGVGLAANAVVMSVLAVSSMSGSIHPRLTWFALAPVPLIMILILLLGTQIQHRFRKVQEAFSSISDRMSESISGIQVIKAYGQEDEEVVRFDALNRQSRDSQMRMTRVSAATSPVVSVLFGVSFAIALIYGSQLVMDGTISLGHFVAFFGYLALIVSPVQSMARITNLLQRGLASWKRYKAIMDEVPAVRDSAGTVPVEDLPEKSRGSLTIRGLNFFYPGNSQPALQNIDLDLEPGRRVGIIGRTGSGKSTIANLLVRLYESPPGSILLDGRPISDLPLNWLRRQISVAPQDNFLFAASISENICFFECGISDEEINKVVHIAGLDEMIRDMPKGLQTVIGERGITLSGGQKQRVGLARALLKNAPVLVLDDTLSAVDTETERQILASLKESAAGKACLIIANRVSALQACDEILVMENGQIAERGTHEELVARHGLYASIASRQTSHGRAGR
jgi:ATP-binding cassette, subfamily B, multidrug efflux pump